MCACAGSGESRRSPTRTRSPRASVDGGLRTDVFFDRLRTRGHVLKAPGTSMRRAVLAAARQASTGGLEHVTRAPSRERVMAAALMEHLGHAAAESENEAEAEAFVGAAVPLVAHVVPAAGPVMLRVAPALIRRVRAVARTLRGHGSTRPLVRVLPAVLRRTGRSLGSRIRRGAIVTPQLAVRIFAGHTRRILTSSPRSVSAWQRSRALDALAHRGGSASAGARPCCAACASHARSARSHHALEGRR